MKVSLNVIKQLINFELPPVDELVQRINQQLGKVDRVENLAEHYRGARVVRVVECAKHPNADRLSVTKIDMGRVAAACKHGASQYPRGRALYARCAQAPWGAEPGHAGCG